MPSHVYVQHIAQWLSDNRTGVTKVFLSQKFKESICKYHRVLNAIANSNLDSDIEFKNPYSDFFAIQGASGNWRSKYFEILRKHLISKEELSISDAIIAIKDGRTDKIEESFNFSFASKMLHCLKPEQNPIIDKNVCQMLWIPDIPKNNFGVKLKYAIEQYNYLKDCHKALKNSEIVQELITDFKRDSTLGPMGLTDLKIVDSILWATYELRQTEFAPE